jgi:type IV secretory pathway VirB10-like protein
MSGNLDPNTSPKAAAVVVRPPGRGVRRLNNLPLIGVFVIAVLVGGTIIYTFNQRMQEEAKRAGAGANTNAQAGSANDVLSHAPAGGFIEPRTGATSPASAPPQDQQAQKQRQLNPIEQAQLQAWQDYEQRRTQLAQARFQAEVGAIGASPDVRLAGSSNFTQAAQAGAPGPGGASAQGQGGAAAPTLDTQREGPQAAPTTTTVLPGGGFGYGGYGGGGLITSGGGIPPANSTANDQTGKRNFLAQPGGSASDDYLQARITAPVSPYEVKAGTVIPATMIGGINSDLPGQVIAQVRENVYDTATGHHLLIPQGSRLVGVYHSGISYGQTRVLVAWNRVIYPNANSFDLGTMPGADEGGYAGFEDQVNNHYLRIFGSALLASVFSAGTQLSQPQNSNGNVNSTQILAASIGQQANQVGSQLIARGLDIQPTLEIRNGYLFNIMVTKDLILQPWDGMQPLSYGAPGR